MFFPSLWLAEGNSLGTSLIFFGNDKDSNNYFSNTWKPIFVITVASILDRSQLSSVISLPFLSIYLVGTVPSLANPNF